MNNWTGKTRSSNKWYICEKCGRDMPRAGYARYPTGNGEFKALCKNCNRDWTFAPDGSLIQRPPKPGYGYTGDTSAAPEPAFIRPRITRRHSDKTPRKPAE